VPGEIDPLENVPAFPENVPPPGFAEGRYKGALAHKAGTGLIVGVTRFAAVTASVLVTEQFDTEEVTTTE